MKVLHVAYGLTRRIGGSALYVTESASALQRAGVEVAIFSTDMAGAATARPFARADHRHLAEGAELLDVHMFPTRRPYRLAFSPSLWSALQEKVDQFDIVHIHMLWLFPQYAAFHHASRRGVPHVVSLHGNLRPYVRSRGRLRKAVTHLAWQGRMLREASALHVTTDEEARVTADVAPEVRRFVIPGGINPAAFRHLPAGDDFRARYLGGYTGRLVIFLGRIAYTKGLDVLVRAVALVAREVGDCHLAVIGPDDERLTPKLTAVARAEGVAGQVTFTGPLYGRERLAAMAAADVWALASHTENFGIAVVEALAAGLPVLVSTGVSISPELEAAGAAVVSAPDPASVASQLSALFADPERRAVLARRGREFAERYDWDAIAPQLASMYQQVLSGVPSPARPVVSGHSR